MKLIVLILCLLGIPTSLVWGESLSSHPSDQRLSEMQKQQLAKELTHEALAAYKAHHFQAAIDLAERMRDLNIKADKAYLENARKIILASSKHQKEGFEPSLIKAMQLYTKGDYRGSAALCQNLLKQDPSYDEAKRCVEKAQKKLSP